MSERIVEAFAFTHTIILDVLDVEKRLDAKCDPNGDGFICEHDLHAAGYLDGGVQSQRVSLAFHTPRSLTSS